MAVLTWDNAQPWDSPRTWDGLFDGGPPPALDYGRAVGAQVFVPLARLNTSRLAPAAIAGDSTPAPRANLGTTTSPRASGGTT